MKTKDKIYITLGSSILSIILLISFAVLPLFRGITENAAEFLAAKESVASLEAEMKNISALLGQYEKYKLDLEKIDALFINEEVPIDFIRFLEQLGLDSGLLVVISPASNLKNENQTWQSLNFKLSVSGASFLSFSRFLEKLENAPYLIEVQNLNIRAVGQQVDVDFTIKVFAK